MVNIDPHAVEQSVRWVLKAFVQHAPKFADQKVVLAFVQQNRDGRDVRRAEVGACVREMLWVRGALIGDLRVLRVDGRYRVFAGRTSRPGRSP
jgi:hypothetical protein